MNEFLTLVILLLLIIEIKNKRNLTRLLAKHEKLYILSSFLVTIKKVYAECTHQVH